jgi:carbon monoxide dehydrogenase subunit G
MSSKRSSLHGNSSLHGKTPRSGALRLREYASLLVLLTTMACSPLAQLPPAENPAPAAEPLEEEQPITPEERTSLEAGGRVERPMVFYRAGQRYLGGVGYALVNASPDVVFSTLNDLETLAEVLGGTRRMTIVEQRGNQVRVELEQGNALVSATYSIVFEQSPPTDGSGARLVRFWLDPARPHGIQDVWGFFRLTRYGSGTLVSAGTALNLGPGLIQRLFENSLQGSILRMPKRVRQAVDQARQQKAKRVQLMGLSTTEPGAQEP